MSLRIKLFLGILLFFASTLSFFGYMAYDSAVQSGTAREVALLQDLSSSLSRDLRTDIGTQPSEAAIERWLTEFNSLHLAILITSGNRQWLSDAARNELPSAVKHQIMTSPKSGSAAVDQLSFVWDTSPVADTPYTLSVIHRTNTHEAYAFFKRLELQLILSALIVVWVAIWSTQLIASLLEKLNSQKDKLQHQAMHDALTNLPNRAVMLDRLQVAMHDADRSKSELALLFIDLNRFKEINDTLGHHYGDLLLIEISRRLASGIRKSDTVARLGGDEFAVILGHISDEDATAMAAKLTNMIGQAIEINGNKLFVSGSIGIARYPTHAQDANTLVQYADVAMYAAKRSGIDYIIYDAKLDEYSREKLILSNDLRDAIKLGQLSVHYQPKIDIKTGAIIGGEALLRWKHATLGFISPDRFIPLAEQTGLIRALTEFVLETAMPDLQQLLREGHDMSFAINISPISLQDPELANMLLNSVKKSHIPPARVVLEITETAVMDKSLQTREVLQALDGLGFRISMDDFGTGHSSLVNLRLLPLQEIKVDRSFVMNMLRNEDDATIVRTIINLGHSLGKKVVAEGVESEAILQTLTNFGCDIAQGYHFSKPMPFDAFKLWLGANSGAGKTARLPSAVPAHQESSVLLPHLAK